MLWLSLFLSFGGGAPALLLYPRGRGYKEGNWVSYNMIPFERTQAPSNKKCYNYVERSHLAVQCLNPRRHPTLTLNCHQNSTPTQVKKDDVRGWVDHVTPKILSSPRCCFWMEVSYPIRDVPYKTSIRWTLKERGRLHHNTHSLCVKRHWHYTWNGLIEQAQWT
jgi:hypothetical protein